MQHSRGFIKMVDASKKRIRELTIQQVREKQQRGEKFILVDVREDKEWDAGRVKGSIHLGKGIIERDIEEKIQDHDAEIILYCGGGFRSALAADTIQQMGYKNVYSMDGGIRAWREAGLPEDK